MDTRRVVCVAALSTLREIAVQIKLAIRFSMGCRRIARPGLACAADMGMPAAQTGARLEEGSTGTRKVRRKRQWRGVRLGMR